MRIVIAHTPGYEPWLYDLLESIAACGESWVHEVEVIKPGGWVTDQLRYAGNLMAVKHEDFFFLNETTIIKDAGLFDDAEAIDGPAALSPDYLMFMGKYTADQLRKVKWPDIRNKRDDVILGEAGVCRDQLAPGVPVLCPEFVDPDDKTNTVWRHGRVNLVLENEYLIKYKATWDLPEA